MSLYTFVSGSIRDLPTELRSTGSPSEYNYSLPPELWFEIFRHLPQEALFATTLTHSVFRTLAQPLYFRTLSFSLSPSPEKYDAAALQSRLDFLAVPQVACGVHEVRICAPFGSGNQFTARHRECPPDLDLILPFLQRFHSLRSLAFIHVPFSPPHLLALRSLNRVDSALFYACRTASLPGDHLALRNTRPALSQLLDVRDLSLVEDSHFKPIRVALGIPHMHSLISLTLSDAPSAAAFLRDLRSSSSADIPPSSIQPCLPSLQSLSLPVSPSFLKHILLQSHHYPNLSDLRLSRKTLVEPSTYASVALELHTLPHEQLHGLTTYHGPIQGLPLVAPRALRRLLVWHGPDEPRAQLEERVFITPDDLAACLQNAGDAVAQVESLEVNLTALSSSVLQAISACCPHLKELEVHVSGGIALNGEEGAIAGGENRTQFSRTLLSRRYMPLLARARITSRTRASISDVLSGDLALEFPHFSVRTTDVNDLTLTWV